jgi:hypothetical protein
MGRDEDTLASLTPGDTTPGLIDGLAENTVSVEKTYRR